MHVQVKGSFSLSRYSYYSRPCFNMYHYTLARKRNKLTSKLTQAVQLTYCPYKGFISLKIKQPLQPPHHKLTSYTGNMLPVIGMVRPACVHKSNVTETMFYVVEGNAPPFISLQTSIDLGLLQLTYPVESTLKQCDNQLIERDYADLFKGIGGNKTAH